MERIYQVVRLAGLPLAMGTGDAGVYLEREDPISGPISYVVISWHTTDRLFDTSEETPGPRAHAADKLLSAACPAIEDALEKILAAAWAGSRQTPRDPLPRRMGRPGDFPLP